MSTFCNDISAKNDDDKNKVNENVSHQTEGEHLQYQEITQLLEEDDTSISFVQNQINKHGLENSFAMLELFKNVQNDTFHKMLMDYLSLKQNIMFYLKYWSAMEVHTKYLEKYGDHLYEDDDIHNNSDDDETS